MSFKLVSIKAGRSDDKYERWRPVGVKDKIAVLVLAICLFSMSFAVAQVENDTKKNITKPPPTERPREGCPSEEACELWEEFKERYGENWQVKWSKYTGAPEKIYGYHYDMGMGDVTDESKA
ncbi:MAG: hypothetical protein V3R86_07885, partial [Candidatus Hydrothermarchaeaceae archaeon]